jgi:predicted nucleic acid-binding protein
VVWIGAKLKNDQWHKESAKIINKFINKEIKKVYVTDHIILESVNFILRKASNIFKKYPGLSITDASTVAVMEELGIKKIYTFDKGFDMIDWVVRLK